MTVDASYETITAIVHRVEGKHNHRISPVTVRRVLAALNEIQHNDEPAVGTVRRDPQTGTIAMYSQGDVYKGWGAMQLDGKLFRLEQHVVANWDVLYEATDV